MKIQLASKLINPTFQALWKGNILICCVHDISSKLIQMALMSSETHILTDFCLLKFPISIEILILTKFV